MKIKKGWIEIEFQGTTSFIWKVSHYYKETEFDEDDRLINGP